MKNQFYKIYLIILLIGAIIIWSFGQIVDRYYANADDYELNLQQIFQYQKMFAPESLKKVPLQSMPLPDKLNQKLLKGKIIALKNTDDQTYFYQLEGEATLLQLGPFNYSKTDDISSYFIVIVFYICLAALLIFTIRPLFIDLQKLQDQASQFSLNAVLPDIKISNRSAIFPLASTFQTMAVKIAELLSVHKYLSRTIAHDIRTPLARMKFVIEALDESIPAKYRLRFFQDIDEMESLAEDYLNFSRMESSAQLFRQEEIAIKPWLENLLKRFELPNTSVELELHCTDVQIFCHPKHLERAIQNLISNALKFAESQVRVTFQLSPEGKQIIVEDDGSGFSEDASKLFSKFKYAPSENTKSFGFGLYITQKVAEWHGGTVKPSRSQTLGGARFEFSWPCYIDA